MEKQLQMEIAELRKQLAEKNDELKAIQLGNVDSIVVPTTNIENKFSLSSLESPYQVFIEELNEGTAVLSEDGTILNCNRKFAQLMSVPIEQIVGSYLSRFISESGKKIFNEFMKSGLKDKSSGEFSYKNPDGDVRYFNLFLSKYQSAAINQINLIISDITELKKKEMELTSSRLALLNMMEEVVEAKKVLETSNKKLNEEIHARRLAEELIRESETKYRNLFNNDLTSNFITSVNGTILLCNPAFAKILGYNTVEELENENITSFYKESDSLEEFVALVCEKKKIELYEREFIRRDGKVIHVIENVVGEFNEDGELFQLKGYMFDNTERKQLEEARKELEARYHELYNSIRDAILVADTDRNIIDCNSAFTSIFGYSFNDIKNKKTITLYENEEQFNELGKALKDHSNDKSPFLYTVNYKKKNGIVFPGETSIYFLKNPGGEVIGFIGLIRDVTERIAAEQIIQREKYLLRTLVDNLPSAIYIKNLEGKKLLANKADLKNLGLSNEQEAFDKTDFDLFTTEAAAKFYEDDQKVLRDNLTIRDREENFIDHDGNEHWLLTSKLPLYDKDGKIEGLLGIGHDITQRKEAENRQTLLTQILLILNRQNEWKQLLIDILNEIKLVTGLEAAAIRLKQAEDFPFAESNGFQSNFLETANSLCDRNSDGEIECDANGTPTLGCLCGSVLQGRTSNLNAYFTDGGSFWTNSLTEFLNSYSDVKNKLVIRNQCTDEGFESIALIPLRSGNTVIGLLQFNDKRPGRFNLDIIHFFEKVGSTIGIAYKRMETEKKIKESEEQFRYLYENSTTCMYRFTPQGNFLLVNTALLTMLGCSSLEELNSDRIFQSKNLRLENGEFFWEILENEGGIYGHQDKWLKKDGTVIYVRESVKAIKNNNETIYYEGTAEDITISKNAADEIKRSEKQFRSIWENSFDGMRLLDENGIMVSVNLSFCKQMQMHEKDLIGQPFYAIFKDKEEECNKNCRHNLEYQKVRTNFELEFNLCSGDKKWFSVSNSSLETINGETLLLSIFRDITDWKLHETELRSAKEKAEKADKLKSEFLAQMSHEIRSPMHAVVSFASLLREDLGPNLQPEFIEYLNGIDSAGFRLIRTVDLILNVAELQVGTYEPTFTDFGIISEIINKIRNDYQNIIESKGLEFKIESNTSDVLVSADKYSVYQLFVNLFDNAFKYTHKGSITVLIDRDISKRNVSISIEDTGIGMSQEFMETMYEPFLQEDRGISRTFEGNGLGLSLVKKYCDLNNITIEVESEKGVGSKFTLVFKYVD